MLSSFVHLARGLVVWDEAGLTTFGEPKPAPPGVVDVVAMSGAAPRPPSDRPSGRLGFSPLLATGEGIPLLTLVPSPKPSAPPCKDGSPASLIKVLRLLIFASSPAKPGRATGEAPRSNAARAPSVSPEVASSSPSGSRGQGTRQLAPVWKVGLAFRHSSSLSCQAVLRVDFSMPVNRFKVSASAN